MSHSIFYIQNIAWLRVAATPRLIIPLKDDSRTTRHLLFVMNPTIDKKKSVTSGNTISAGAPESGNNVSGFSFRYPFFDEDVFLNYPNGNYLKNSEKEEAAYSFLKNCVFPIYNEVRNYTSITKELKDDLKMSIEMYNSAFRPMYTWIDKEKYKETLFTMLEYSTTHEFSDGDNDFRRMAMMLYKHLIDLSEYIFDMAPDTYIKTKLK